MSRSSRATGTLYLLTAVLGMILSLTGLVLLWTIGPRVRVQAIATIDLASRAVGTSDQGLNVLVDSLNNTHDSIQLMQTTSEDIAASLDQTVPMVDEMGTLVGKNMSDVIRNMQTSLIAAQSSAKLVDDTLSLITALPLIGRRYSPSQSLSSSIVQISNSLDGLPEELGTLQTNLTVSSNNIRDVQSKIVDLSTNLGRVAKNIQDAQDVVRQYQVQIGELKANLGNLARVFPLWMTVTQVGLTLFFLWLGLAQVSMAVQGLNLLRGGYERDVEVLRE
jgi:hypothetical protein